jgi:hypothetical protein
VICRGEIACPSLFFSIRLERIRFGAFTCSAGIAVFRDCSKLGIGARNQTVLYSHHGVRINGTENREPLAKLIVAGNAISPKAFWNEAAFPPAVYLDAEHRRVSKGGRRHRLRPRRTLRRGFCKELRRLITLRPRIEGTCWRFLNPYLSATPWLLFPHPRRVLRGSCRPTQRVTEHS